MKITVVTPTIRPEGLSFVENSLKKQTMANDIEWCFEINTTDKVDFNQAMNRMLKRAKGELIVSLQDYIMIPPDAIEKLWDFYVENPNTFVTCPVGKTMDYKDITYDWREHRKGTCEWQEWEIDFGSASLKALKDIGGFDESLDEYWGFDNCIVGKKAQIKGYTFACLPENKSIAYDHNKNTKHPFLHLRNEMFYNNKLREIESGDWVDYLK